MSVRTEVYSVDDFFHMVRSQVEETWVIVADDKLELKNEVNRVMDEMDAPCPMHSFILLDEGRTILMEPEPTETLLKIKMGDDWYSCTKITEPTPEDLELLEGSVLGPIDD